MNSIITQDSIFTDLDFMASLQKFSEVMAQGKCTVPQHLQGNQADCMAIAMQAAQWGMNPYAVAQKTHIINGVLGYEAQLVNAVISTRAPIKARLNFEWFGDWQKIVGKFKTVKSKAGKDFQVPDWNPADERGLGIRVSATLKGEDEPRTLELLMAQATVRNSTLWTADPKQQLAYLATKRWARLYCPDVLLGVYTPDEIQDRETEREIDAHVVSKTSTSEQLDSLRKGGKVEKVDTDTGEIIEQEPEQVGPTEFEMLCKRFEDCTTAEEIAAVAGGIMGNDNLTDEDKEKLRDLYVQRMKDITDKK